MLVEGLGSRAIAEADRARAQRDPLRFDSARQAIKTLADLETYERGSDALGYATIQHHARVRFYAYEYLRAHPLEAGCVRADDLRDEIDDWRHKAAVTSSEAERQGALEAAAEAADALSAQLAELAKLTARGEAA